MLESFLKLLAGEKPECVVWTADISYWIDGRRHDGTADPAWETEEGYLQLHVDMRVMPYYYYEKFWVAEAVYDDTVRSRQENQGDREIRTLETPIGNLREESVFLPESCCYGVVKHMVETEADLDTLLYALEHRHLEPHNLEEYPERRELWARYGGLPCLGLRRSPLVHFPDNLSSDNLTGYYDAHMRERHQHRLQRLHAAGVKAAVHLDGSVRGLLPKLVEVGFDAIEALTPQPAGDLTVDEMSEIAGNAGVILWGGAPGIMFASPYTWEDMQRHVEHVLETWGKRPFVLGVADQVPPDGDIEFCRKIRDMLGGE